MRSDPRFGPHGEPVASPAYRAAVDLAARDALAAIAAHRRGEIDDVEMARALVDDEYLREIAPIALLRGFIGVEARGASADEIEAEDELLDDDPLDDAASDEDVAERASIAADRDALAAHVEQWRRDHPSTAG